VVAQTGRSRAAGRSRPGVEGAKRLSGGSATGRGQARELRERSERQYHRWGGFAGAVLLAAGGYLAGAWPGPAPASQSEALWGDGGWFRVGLLAYVAGLVLLGWAWWRLGPVPDRPLRWVLATGALWAAPLLVAPPLGSRDVYAYACQGAVWWDGHDPYAVGAAAGGCPWLETVPALWHETTTPYGPLALLVSAGAVGLARALATSADAQLLVAIGVLRAVAVLGAVLVAGFGPRLARAAGVDPAGAAWLGLVTPLVAVHVVAGAHHDALVAGLVVAGLALAASPGGNRLLWTAAGLALGLAVAVKVTALVALPFALLLAWQRSRRGAGAMAAGAAAGFGGLTAATGLGLGWTGALADTGALAQWSSPPTGLGMAAGYLLRGLGAPDAYDGAVAVARWLGLVVLVVLSAWLLLRAWRRRGDPGAVLACAGAVLAAVVVLGPVVYPWYAVAALAVLAATIRDQRVRRGLAVATLVLVALTLPSGLGVPVLTKFPGAMLTALAAVGLAAWWWHRHRSGRLPGGRVSAR
jgi:hypothetical protein